ncbi:hypothetical protein JQC92_13500 [Shewanella sp. 202IG2-18]|nr:hypothetical protein [Parashewanella hymeniacidonis]
MITLNKKYIPLLYFTIISISWSFYYQTNTNLNQFGAANYEWLFLADSLIVLPAICWLCSDSRSQALNKTIVLCLLSILVGSFIIPEKDKLIWPYLESLRYVALVAFIVFEAITLWTVYSSIKISLEGNQDPDEGLEKAVENQFGTGPFSKLLTLETRMWIYLFFSHKIEPKSFIGQSHYTYWQKDGNSSNALGFILIILFEIPMAHLLLHFVWSPLAANVVSVITIFSLAFFWAEYRAMKIRPVSIVEGKVFIRYGVYNTYRFNIIDIKSIRLNTEFIKRSDNIKRFNFSGNPNIEIILKRADSGVDKIYLGLDQPHQFISDLIEQERKYHAQLQ